MTRRIAGVLGGLGMLLAGCGAMAQESPPGEELAHRYGCFQCHGVVPQHGAPSFPQIAQRYARRVDRDPDFINQLAGQVRFGPSHGGSPAMPAFRRISKGDLHTVLRWVLTQQ